jgi:hypothetical protein
MQYGTLLDGDYSDYKKLQDTLRTTKPNAVVTNPDNLYNDRIDMNQYEYIGWSTISDWNPLVQRLFTKTTVKCIQEKTAEYLVGVDPSGKKIMPTERVVIAAMHSIFKNFHPTTGDIYGKYTVVNQSQRDDYSYIVDQTISLLVQGIRDDLGMAEQNQKLTIWTTLYGDFNDHGLRQTPPIKINNKRPDPMLFHMRY